MSYFYNIMLIPLTWKLLVIMAESVWMCMQNKIYMKLTSYTFNMISQENTIRNHQCTCFVLKDPRKWHPLCWWFYLIISYSPCWWGHASCPQVMGLAKHMSLDRWDWKLFISHMFLQFRGEGHSTSHRAVLLHVCTVNCQGCERQPL